MLDDPPYAAADGAAADTIRTDGGTGVDDGAGDAADGGTYTLVIELPTAATAAVGALDEVAFDDGWYAYVGSARGPGGFARVARHCELASGGRDARHWHVDYLLGETPARPRAVAYSRGVDVECAVAAALGGRPIDAFGASDCGCPTHLRRFDGREQTIRAVERAHRCGEEGGGG